MTERRLVWSWAARVWGGRGGLLAVILALTVVSAALIGVLPWMWQFFIDEVREGGEPVRLDVLAGWMVAAVLAHSVVYLTLQTLRAWINARIEWRGRRVVFDHLTELDPAFYRRWRTGDLVTRLYDDAGEKISWFLCSGVFRAVEAFFVVVACLIAMVWLDPVLTAWVILPLPLLLIGQATIQSALGRRYGRVQAGISAINNELSTTFGGIRIIQAAGLGSAARARFVAAGEQQQQAEVDTARVQQAMFLMFGYGWQLGVIVLLVVGGLRVMDGSLSLGAYVSFQGFATTLVWPMFDMGTFVSKYKQAGVAMRRLQELMDEPPMERPDAQPAQDAGLHAQIAQVVAEDGAVLLEEVALELEAGQTLAVVGEVGAGKTVLVQVLAGTRQASGQVQVGGAPVDGLLDRSRVLGWVPQDPVLLSATLRDNILLGREVEDADLDRALELSRLRQDLPAFPLGLETRVGERGVTLSGGQQQRVALARALVGRPRLLLLDDATAALDADTEAAFWEGLRQAEPELTAVVVTHRVGVLQLADQIVVLDRGKVVQQGRHDALVAQDGPYRRLYGRLRANQHAAAQVAGPLTG